MLARRHGASIAAGRVGGRVGFRTRTVRQGSYRGPRGYTAADVTVGASLFLIAAGAILRYAVTWRNSDVDIPTVGLILLIVGVVGLIVSIAYMVMATDRRGDAVVRERDPRDPRDPRGPPRY